MDDTTTKLPPIVEAELRALWVDFAGKLPPAAYSGEIYEPKPGDRFADRSVHAPNGVYRVVGADWLFRISGGRLVSAARAKPPNYGGKNVVSVPATPAG